MYKQLKWITIGLGYNYANFNVDSTNSDYSGEFDWKYDGGLLYAKFGFGKI